MAYFGKPKRIRQDGEELEIVYEVQWKTPGNDDDKAKIIGILDTPDTNLDWNTFKSYLIQNSGNMRLSTNDIKISYVDSDDDVIPVDSEMEFRECLKFSRVRARHGRKIVMKVMTQNGGAKPKEVKIVDDITKTAKPKLFCLKKKDINPDSKKKQCTGPDPNNGLGYQPWAQPQSMVAPPWFECYMKKFKAELVQEITDAVVTNVSASLHTTHHSRHRSKEGVSRLLGHLHHHLHKHSTAENKTHQEHSAHDKREKRKEKKKVSEEDSSDCADGLPPDSGENTLLLRQMQKLNKREKKFEKKLDAKLEKLESKTRKFIEKKSYLLNECKAAEGSSKRKARLMMANALVNNAAGQKEHVMDALPAEEYNYVPHVWKDEVFSQEWKVINNGQLPWTEETELRFAWGSKSLVPLTTSVKCPLLQPGETGRVEVFLKAPMFPGNFESYWHFHHNGRRFGHWLGCSVIVDDKPPAETATKETPSAPPEPMMCSDTAVDLTMKCQTKYVTSTTDDMKIFNSEVKAEQEQAAACSEAYEKEICSHMNGVLHQLNMESEKNSWPNFLTNVPSGPDNNLLNIKETKSESGSPTEKEINKVENITQGVANLTIYGIPEEWKNDEVPPDLGVSISPRETRQDTEYISGSDSDNISVISGTISINSEDTEPSDEFVVIPMPPCFNCEQAMADNNPVMKPISVEIPKTPSEVSDVSVHVQASDNNNNMELKPYPEIPICLPVLLTPTENAQGQESGYSEGETEPEPKSQETPIKKPQEPDSKTQSEPVIDDQDPNNVYVRDSAGKSVPVAKVILNRKDDESAPKHGAAGFNVNVGISHNTFGDPNVGHGPNGPRFPFGFGHENNGVPPQCHNPGGSANFRPQHDCPKGPSAPPPNRSSETFCSHTFAPDPTFFRASPEACPCSNMPNCHTFPPRNFPFPPPPPSFNMHFKCSHDQPQQQQPQSPPSQPQKPAQPPPKHRTSGSGDSHSRKSSTSSSSRSWSHSFQNIHTEQPRSTKHTFDFDKEQKKSASNSNSSRNSTSSSGSREASPVASAVQILPDSLVTGAVHVARTVIDMLIPRHDNVVVGHREEVPSAREEALRKLSEMGFNNRELNIMLLENHNNDINRVITELIH